MNFRVTFIGAIVVALLNVGCEKPAPVAPIPGENMSHDLEEEQSEWLETTTDPQAL